jgi:UDP-N-acetylglucosamine 2-epimerase (non-hydrolysing)
MLAATVRRQLRSQPVSQDSIYAGETSSMPNRIRVGVVFGTRPEAIKMAPVVFALRSRPHEFEPVLISTAQHRDMLDQVLRVFNIEPDIDLGVMRPNQSLGELTARALQEIEGTLPSLKLDCLMVQGDTTTVFAAELCAFYHRIPVAHVEAGLRSRSMYNPYPEEANRRLASILTTIHFAPTPLSRRNLLDEGVAPADIVVTGNTVIDALTYLQMSKAIPDELPAGVPYDESRLVLVTSHRRESWGNDLENICDALDELVEQFSDIRVIYPVHLNPNVRNTVQQRLGSKERVHLTPPLKYFEFLSLLQRCYMVLTDSGGVQEEAPSFGKPVLVLRRVTERPEAAAAGLARVIGTSHEVIMQEASHLLRNPSAYRAMTSASNPFGDGRAAQRIAEALARWSQGERRLLDEVDEFRGTATLDEIAA